MKFGLKDTTIENIGAVLAGFPQVERAVLYGSRAKGNYRNGSDIDLTLHGKDLTLNVIYKIDQEIDDLLLPYTLDLSILERLTDPDLIDHIRRVGVVFYQRDSQAA
jgi:predicted nucleotidyltransferase